MNSSNLANVPASIYLNSSEDILIPEESVSCPVCFSSNYTTRVSTPDYKFNTPGVFTIMQCNDCSMCYLSPRYSQLQYKFIYPEVYASSYKKASSKRHLKNLKRRLQVILGISKGGKLLEIGSAAGYFLNMAQQAGFDVMGVEADERTSMFARDNFGLKVLNSTIEDASLEPNQFEIVCLFDVLEHLHSPLDSLRKLRSSLKENGAVVLSVPNFACLESRIWGRYWYGLDVPRHLSHFSPQTLKNLMSKAGYKKIEIRHVGESNYGVFSFSRYVSRLLKRTPSSLNNTPLNRSEARKLSIAFSIIEILNWPIVKLLSLAKNGNSLIAIGYK